MTALMGCSSTKQPEKDLNLVIKYEILDFEECTWKFIPDIIDPRHPGEFYVMLRAEYTDGVFLFPLNIDTKLRKAKDGFIRTAIRYNRNNPETMYLTLLDEDELNKGINSLLTGITVEADIKYFRLKKSLDSVAILNDWDVCGEQTARIGSKPPSKEKPLIVNFDKVVLRLYYE